MALGERALTGVVCILLVAAGACSDDDSTSSSTTSGGAASTAAPGTTSRDTGQATTTGAAGTAAQPTTTIAPARKPAPEKVAIGIRVDIDTFDPNLAQGNFGQSQARALVYDTLVRRTADGELVPGMASNWDVTPTTGTFTIRDGLTCPDGTALDAEAVAASLRHTADPATGAIYASRIFGAAGAESITADPAAKTVTITLKEPNSDMLAGLETNGQIVCPSGLADLGALATQPVGTGPYQLTSAKRGESYNFERRNDFTALPEGVAITDLPKTIVLRVVTDDSTQANLLLTGELDIANLQGRDTERLRREKDLVEVEGLAYGAQGTLFNWQSPIGKDPAFRRAIALAYDPDDYNKVGYAGLASPAKTLHTRGMDCYEEGYGDDRVRGDIDAAKKALDAAGYVAKGGKRVTPTGAPLTVRLIGQTDLRNEAEYQKSVLDKLGIDVKLSIVTFPEAASILSGADWEMVSFPFQSQNPTPSLYVPQISGEFPKTLNFGRVQDAEYEAIVPQAFATTGDERCELWQQAEQVLIDNASIIPLIQPLSHWFGKGVTFSGNYFKVDPYSIASS